MFPMDYHKRMGLNMQYFKRAWCNHLICCGALVAVIRWLKYHCVRESVKEWSHFTTVEFEFVLHNVCHWCAIPEKYPRVITIITISVNGVPPLKQIIPLEIKLRANGPKEWWYTCIQFGMFSKMLTIDTLCSKMTIHDDVIKWKHFPRYWSFVRGIHRWPVNSPHKGQCAGLWCFLWSPPECWVNNREAGDLRRYRAHYDVTGMKYVLCFVHSLVYIYTFTLLHCMLYRSLSASVLLCVCNEVSFHCHLQHGQVITSIITWGVKIFIHSQTSFAQRFKFGNG